MKHALLSPSAAHRWLQCPASLAQDSAQESHPGSAAYEGVKAHALAELLLKGGIPPPDTSPDMLGYAEDYVGAVRGWAQGGVLLAELPVPLADVLPGDSFGTADAVAVTADGELQVHDLKYGHKVVNAGYNPQLMLYARGMLPGAQMLTHISRVRLVIHQPQLRRVSEWVCRPEALLAFGEQARHKAKRALRCRAVFEEQGALPLREYSPQAAVCRYCRGRFTCTAREMEVMHVITGERKQMSEVIQLIVPADGEQLARCYAQLELVEEWVRDIRAKAMSVLTEGKALPGFKLVEGRKGNKAWKDAAEAEIWLTAVVGYAQAHKPPALITPAQAQALLKSRPEGGELKEMAVRSPSSRVIAPQDDPRPAVSVADAFSVEG